MVMYQALRFVVLHDWCSSKTMAVTAFQPFGQEAWIFQMLTINAEELDMSLCMMVVKQSTSQTCTVAHYITLAIRKDCFRGF